jgi:hypothetical protein
MLKAHQTPSKLAHADVETLAKSIKLTKTSPKKQPKQQTHPRNNPARKFLLPGGGTQRPLSLHSPGGQKRKTTHKILKPPHLEVRLKFGSNLANI